MSEGRTDRTAHRGIKFSFNSSYVLHVHVATECRIVFELFFSFPFFSFPIWFSIVEILVSAFLFIIDGGFNRCINWFRSSFRICTISMLVPYWFRRLTISTSTYL